MLRLILLPLLLLAAGCEHNRSTSGTRADLQATDDVVTVEKAGSIKSSVVVERVLHRSENGFLVVEVKVHNTTGRNIPCEWRTVFQDKDGFDLPVTANPWSPVVINANETMPLTKTAPVAGGEKTTFYIREAAPIRK